MVEVASKNQSDEVSELKLLITGLYDKFKQKDSTPISEVSSFQNRTSVPQSLDRFDSMPAKNSQFNASRYSQGPQ